MVLFASRFAACKATPCKAINVSSSVFAVPIRRCRPRQTLQPHPPTFLRPSPCFPRCQRLTVRLDNLSRTQNQSHHDPSTEKFFLSDLLHKIEINGEIFGGTRLHTMHGGKKPKQNVSHLKLRSSAEFCREERVLPLLCHPRTNWRHLDAYTVVDIFIIYTFMSINCIL